MKTCKICGSDDMSTWKGYKSYCVPCASELYHKNWCEKVDKELANYNTEHSTDYDFDTYCLACFDGDVHKETLTNFPELKYVYKNEISLRNEYDGIISPQLEIKFNDDLPF